MIASGNPNLSLTKYRIMLEGNLVRKLPTKFPFKCSSKEKINDPITIDLNLVNLFNNKLNISPLKRNSSQVATMKGWIISSMFIEHNDNTMKIMIVYIKNLFKLKIFKIL